MRSPSTSLRYVRKIIIARIASRKNLILRGELFVWDAKLRIRLQVLDGLSSPVFSVVWSSDGTHLVSGGTDGALHWWDVEQGEKLDTVQAHKGWVPSLQLSPDGKVWELHSHRHLVTLRRDRP
jgi:WD40 repeat protein